MTKLKLTLHFFLSITEGRLKFYSFVSLKNLKKNLLINKL